MYWMKRLSVSLQGKIGFWSKARDLPYQFLLPIIKQTLIIANKMGIATSENYFGILTDYYGHSLVAACSAEAELVLRRAEKMGLLQYTPVQQKFRIKENAELTARQRAALS
jgi:hypothetical protein